MKARYLFVGTGAISGIPAVCYGGYCIYDATLPGYADILKKQGYTLVSWEPSTLGIKNSEISDEEQWKIERFGCFERFFAGAESIQESYEDVGSASYASIQVTDSSTENDDPVGCMLANFKYTSENEFILRSEITVKSNRLGWAVWTYNRRTSNFSTTNTHSTGNNGNKSWNYHILLLEKNSSGVWEVKAAYYLADAFYFNYGSSVSITLPNGKNLLSDVKKDLTYSGIWSTTSGGNKEVFEDIKFEYWNDDDDDKKTAWLGKDRSLGGTYFTGSDFEFNGWYDLSSQKWKKEKKTVNYGTANVITPDDSLNVFYKPFESKKGKWQTTSEYCSSLGSKKRPSDMDKERFKSLCYEKSDSST